MKRGSIAIVASPDSRSPRAPSGLLQAPVTRAYNPQIVLATLYHMLGINPGATIPDTAGRPVYLLDDREVGGELV